jgi:hypothetical protein
MPWTRAAIDRWPPRLVAGVVKTASPRPSGPSDARRLDDAKMSPTIADRWPHLLFVPSLHARSSSLVVADAV